MQGRDDAAVSTLYNTNQKLCVRREEANPEHIITKFQHTQVYDVLIFVDNEMSHSVTPLYPNNPELPANRDMLVSFTRRMAYPNGGFSAAKYDSEEIHLENPFTYKH